jgi:hypothetical protein
MPPDILNAELPTEVLKARIVHGLVNKQGDVKSVIPLHQSMAIGLNVLENTCILKTEVYR